MALTASGDQDIVIRIRGKSNVAEVMQGDQKELRDFGTQAERTSSVASKAFRAIGAAAAAAGIGYFAKEALDAADAVHTLSQQTGFGAERIQTLQFAAGQYSVQQDRLNDALRDFSERIGEARQGTGEAVEGIHLLERTTGRQIDLTQDVNAVWRDFAAAMGEVDDKSTRATVAAQVMGDAGRDIAPIFERGAEGLEKFAAEARSAGLVLTEETVQGAHQANQELDKLYRVVRTQLTRAVAELAPEISELASYLANNTDVIERWVRLMGELAVETSGALAEISRFLSGPDLSQGRVNQDGFLVPYEGFAKDQARLDYLDELILGIRGDFQAAGQAGQQAGAQIGAGMSQAREATAGTRAELERLGPATRQSLDPALSKIQDLSEDLQGLAERQAKLRAEVFQATGGSAGGYFEDQTRQLRQKAREMVEANIRSRDIAEYIRQQANKLEQEAADAGAHREAADLQALAASASTVVGKLERGARRASSETAEISKHAEAASDEIKQAAQQMANFLPEGQAQVVRERLQAMREDLAGLADEASVRAQFDASQAYSEIRRIEQQLASLPSEVTTTYRIVQQAAGDIPPPPQQGSRATGGEITATGLYQLEAGERVVSDSSQTFGDINVYGGGGGLPTDPAQLRAWVRGVLMPELQAAMDR